MEIKEVKPTAEVVYQLKVPEDAPPQELKLTVKYAGVDGVIDYAVNGQDLRELSPSEINHRTIAASIVSWNLHDGDKPVPLTKESAALYAPHIASATTVDGDIVGWELVAFVRERANFLKN
jgi:hypothetical protein